MIGNPYKSVRLKKLKRRSSVKYSIVSVLCAPIYLVHLFSTQLTAITKAIFKLVWAPLRRMLSPFDSFGVFLNQWFATRPWKNLLWIMPLLLVLMVIFSMLFLAYNRPQENIYKAYKSYAYEAIGNENYALASFYFGKAIYLPEASGDPMLLYQAMITASREGDNLRTEALLKRLIEEHNYSYAHMWQASRLLSRPQTDRSNTQRAIEHMKRALEKADDPRSIKIQIARLYFKSGRLDMAISILDEVEDQDWSVLLIKADVYKMMGKEESAVAVAMKILNGLEDSEDLIVANTNIYLGAVSVLTNSTLYKSLASEKMSGIIELMEKTYQFNPSDEAVIRDLSNSYAIMAKLIVDRATDKEPWEGLDYMDKSVSLVGVSGPSVRQVFDASNVDGDGGLTEQELRHALCRGKGLGLAHLLLGINEWRRRDTRATEFHFRNAYAHNPNSLDVIFSISSLMASTLEKRGGSSFTSLLDGEPEWKRVLGLLDITAKIKPDSGRNLLMSKAKLLSERQRWQELVFLIEGDLEKIDKQDKRTFMSILVRAYRETGDKQNAEKYTQLLNEMEVD